MSRTVRPESDINEVQAIVNHSGDDAELQSPAMRSPVLMFLAILSLVACATTETPGGTAVQRPTVEVAAARTELMPRVTQFLEPIAALEPAQFNGGLPDVPASDRGLLPGWNDPVCPQVTGMSQQEAEYILARIAKVARAVGAPVDGADCSPNLYIFVTPQPKELLRGLEQHQFTDTFGRRALPSIIDQFIATPRTVRIWYNIGIRGPPTPFKYAFSRVTVIVDVTHLAGASGRQLADYIALASLAEIRVGAHFGNAPTILRLFDGVPQAARPGLSDWDTAFLQALYSTANWPESWSRLRLNEVASSMVGAIVP